MKGFSILYLLAGLFVVTLAGSLVASYNSGQKARQALSDCIEKNTSLNALISKQNEAVDALKAASEKAQARSRIAQKAARIAVAASLAERDRLTEAAKAGGSCLGGLAQVRKGLDGGAP